MNKHKKKLRASLFAIEQAMGLITGDSMKTKHRLTRILEETDARKELVKSLELYSVGKMKFKDLPERTQKKLSNMKLGEIRGIVRNAKAVPSQAPMDPPEPCPPCQPEKPDGEGATRPNECVFEPVEGSVHNPDNPELEPEFPEDRVTTY